MKIIIDESADHPCFYECWPDSEDMMDHWAIWTQLTAIILGYAPPVEF